MDLGATLCVRARPDCARCPFERDCAAHRKGRETAFPGSKPRRSLPTRHTTFVLALTPGRELFLERRPAQGLWGGLWSFPEVGDARAARAFCRARLAEVSGRGRSLAPVRHSFSHFHLEISPLLLTLSRTPTQAGEGRDLRSWPLGELPDVGLAAPVQRLWLSAGESLGATEIEE